MELLNRYLQAVKPGLPRDERDDILAELSEDIRAQIEDKEAEFGRPLTEAEEGDILKQFGHPLLVAGRYRQDSRTFTFGRQLIGPELFPFYMRGVQWAVGLSVAAVVIVFVVLSMVQGKVEPGIVGTLAFQVLLQFGIQTLVWVGIQSYYSKNPDSWNPNRLPVAKPRPVASVAPSRFESLTQIIVNLAIAPWYLNVFLAPSASIGPFKLDPIWHRVFPGIVTLLVVSLLQSGISLVHPEWVRFRRIAQIANGTLGLVVLSVIVNAGRWVTMDPSTFSDPVRRTQLDYLVNSFIFSWILVITGISVIVSMVWAAWKLYSFDRQTKTQGGTS